MTTRRALRKLKPVRDQWLLVRAAELAERAGVHGPVALRVGLDPCSSTLAPRRAGQQMVILPESHRRFDQNTLDAVLAQDPSHEIRSAIRVLRAYCDDQKINPTQERIRIEIFMRDNLP